MRGALRALVDVQRTARATDEWDYDAVQYLADRLRQLIVTEWVTQGALAESTIDVDAIFAERGARLSAKSKDALEAVITQIRTFIDAPDLEDAAETATEIRAEIDTTVAALEALALNEDPPRDVPGTDPIPGERISESATPTVIIESPLALAPGSGWFRESGMLIGEASGNSSTTPRFDMFVIREGMSKNRILYGSDLLKESVDKINGRPLYVNHPTGFRSGQPTDRGLETKAGWWSDARYVEGVPTSNGPVNGVVATLNLFSASASPQPWLAGMISEAIAAGRPELIGVSIYAGGKWKYGRDDNGVYKEALSFDVFASADAVAEPGAGGEPLSLAASAGQDQDIVELEGLTLEALLAARPDLVEAAVSQANAAVTPPATPTPKLTAGTMAEAAPPTSEELNALVQAQVQELIKPFAEQHNALLVAQTQTLLESKLGQSRWPDSVKQLVRNRVGTGVMAESEIDTILGEYNTVAAAIMGTPTQPAILGPNVIIPFGEGSEQVTPMQQVMYALDDFFGRDAQSDEVRSERRGKFHPIASFKEFYGAVTGDRQVTGWYQRDGALGDAWFREGSAEQFQQMAFVEGAGSLPGATHVVGGGTITMSLLINTTMNKALFNFYGGQDRWWEPIVTKTTVNDFKTQTRVRLHNFGSLTERTTDGTEYTELDWNNTAESYTPTEFGNVVTIGRRAIINDDLRGIASIPRLLAQSAGITINEYVSALFTLNSGNGPTLADGVQVFNAASHQGNRLTLPLTRGNLNIARRTVMKMTNDANKRISLRARHLLVPIDLETDAYELTQATMVPDSANNAPNIIADAQRGIQSVIVVPQWTDADNWYVMADKRDITSIEMGFLFGNEEPEMWLQDNPTNGMVFTHDVITHKIRHDYGGDWLDYRGAIASIV